MVLSSKRHAFSSAILVSGLMHAGLAIALLHQAWNNQGASQARAGLIGSFVELGSVRTESALPLRAPRKSSMASEKARLAEVKNINLAEDSDVSVRSSETAKVENGSDATVRGDAQDGQYDEYTRELVQLIHQKKVYPRMAQKMGHTGRILVTLRIGRDGSILQSDIVEESRFSTLNDAAKKLIQDLRKMKPFPDGVSERFWVFHVPIEYKL